MHWYRRIFKCCDWHRIQIKNKSKRYQIWYKIIMIWCLYFYNWENLTRVQPVCKTFSRVSVVKVAIFGEGKPHLGFQRKMKLRYPSWWTAIESDETGSDGLSSNVRMPARPEASERDFRSAASYIKTPSSSDIVQYYLKNVSRGNTETYLKIIWESRVLKEVGGQKRIPRA